MMNAKAGMRAQSILVAAGVAVLTMIATPAAAQDALFQNFFTTMCNAGGASGGLATACGVNNNIAGDSETSLNPAQVSAGAEISRGRAEAMVEEAGERMEKSRDEAAGFVTAAGGGDEEVSFGRLSLFLNARYESFDRDRKEADEERGYEGDTWGGQIGADYRITDSWVVGALVGFDHTSTNFDADTPSGAFFPFPNEGGVQTGGYFLNVYSSYSITEGL